MKKSIKKSNMLCVFCALFMACLFTFSLTACKDKDSTLTIDNYTKYVDVSAGAYSYGGAGSLRMYTGSVSIKRKSNVELKNVSITYTVSAENFEETKSVSLDALSNEYSKRFEFRITYTGDDIFYYPPVSIEVSAIGGDITSNGNEALYVSLFFLIITLIICAIFIAYYVRLRSKIKRIVEGMTYSEVIDLIGEPSESESAKGIATCVWRSWGTHWRSRTYCTITFKDNKVISIIHRYFF